MPRSSTISPAQRTLFEIDDTPPATQTAPPTAATFCEYFAGIGLARIGLERAGWAIAFANDIDPVKRATYEGHFGEAPYYLCEDIHKLSAEQERVPRALLAHASFPCTDLSVAGGQRGINAGQSSAFWGFVELLAAQGEARPPVVLLENVLGFLTSNAGADFRSALEALADLGYKIDTFTVDAAHFVPQSRPRLFVVAKRGVETATMVDANEHEPSPLRPARLLDAIRVMPDMPWSLADLPDLPPYGEHKLAAIVEDVPTDSDEWWSDERAEYLLSQMSEKHRAIADEMIAGPRWSYGAVFRRVRKGRSMAELRVDGLAGCLRTPKGGSGRQILFAAGGGEYRVRLLNARECARLMGAPDFKVETTLNKALFGFGDAVCADVIEWIAVHYLNPLAEKLIENAASEPAV